MAVEEVEADYLLRAGLGMPVWPFSGGARAGWDGSVEDAGGYWGVGEMAAVGGHARGAYALWSIPAAECVWQGLFGCRG